MIDVTKHSNPGAKLVPTLLTRRELPARRHHTTQKVTIGGPDCSSELIGLYDVIARLMSLALQYGAPLEKVGDLLAGAKFEPCGPVVGHGRIKSCTSLPDLIGRHFLVEYCEREDLAHVSASVKDHEPQERNLSMGRLIEEGLKNAGL